MISKVLGNVLGSSIALAAMAGDAMAGDLYSGPVFSANQVFVACEITNASLDFVHITGKSIFNKIGGTLLLTGNTCGPELPPFNTCTYFASGVATNTVHTCFIRITEPNNRVRATAFARNSANVTYSESQMR